MIKKFDPMEDLHFRGLESRTTILRCPFKKKAVMKSSKPGLVHMIRNCYYCTCKTNQYSKQVLYSNIEIYVIKIIIEFSKIYTKNTCTFLYFPICHVF